MDNTLDQAVSFRVQSSKYPHKLKKRRRRGKKVLPNPEPRKLTARSPELLMVGDSWDVLRHFPEIKAYCGSLPPWEDDPEVIRKYEEKVWASFLGLLSTFGS